MNKKKLLHYFLVLTIAVLIVSTAAVYADEAETNPSFTVTNVEVDKSVTVLTRDFPANADFTAEMGDASSKKVYIDAAKFNTQAGGSFSVTFPIPDSLKGVQQIAMILASGDTISITGSFANTAADTASATATPAAATSAISAPAVSSCAVGSPYCSGYRGYPSFTISSVKAGESVVLHGYNFPSNLDFNITMGSYKPFGVGGQPVSVFNSKDGGETEITVSIPENLKSVSPLSIRMDSPAGFYAYNWFVNKNSSTNSSAAAAASACNYSVIPSFTIKSVVKGKSVTIDTVKFPANSKFTVKMGQYVNGKGPAFCGHDFWFSNDFWFSMKSSSGFIPFNNDGMYQIYPQWGFPSRRNYDYSNSRLVFSGIDAGEFETGDGSEQTATFAIPDSIKNYNPIVIWIQDEGSCGFYAYNYFWNQNFPVTADTAAANSASEATSTATETAESTAPAEATSTAEVSLSNGTESATETAPQETPTAETSTL